MKKNNTKLYKMLRRLLTCLLLLCLTAALIGCGKGQSGQSGQAGQPGQSGQAGQPGQSGQIGQSGQAGQDSTAAKGREARGPVRVVASIYPVYDWLGVIIGDQAPGRVELSLLLKSGTEMHGFQPSVGDTVSVSEADLFVYVGGESDAWAKEMLEVTSGKDLCAIELISLLGNEVKAEELVPGMQSEKHDDEHDDETAGMTDDDDEHDDETAGMTDDDDEHDDETAGMTGEDGEHDDETAGMPDDDEHEHDDEAPDEHIWLSLSFAETICRELTTILCDLDPGSEAVYKENLRSYLEKLSSLNDRFARMAEQAARKTVMVADRFPFRYLFDDYDISYYAAFPGCRTESQASFETVMFLSDKLKELSLPAVFVLETGDARLAETIIESSGRDDVQVLVLDAMQSYGADTAPDGGYLTIMEKNLDALTIALNE